MSDNTNENRNDQTNEQTNEQQNGQVGPMLTVEDTPNENNNNNSNNNCCRRRSGCGCVGRIVLYAVIGGIAFSVIKSCVDGYILKNNFKNNGNTKPTTSVTDVTTQPTTADVTEAHFVHNTEEYVNEDIYNTLVSAKAKYDELFNNGSSVSENLINNGVMINVNDSGNIDSNVRRIYSLISDYIGLYKNGNYESCYNIGFQLNELTYSFSKNYLYSIMVMNNVDSEFKSNIKYDDYGNVLYQYGNITLENGKQMRILGGYDSLIYQGDSTDFSSRMKWVESIPEVLSSSYTQIRNIDNDGVCYIVNASKASSYCTQEIDNILCQGAAQYNFDASYAVIKMVGDDYAFVDTNNNVLGLLDYNQKNTYEKVKTIREAITTGRGDCLLLDSYISDIYSKQSNNGYNK